MFLNLNLNFILKLYKMLNFFQISPDVKTGMLDHSDVGDIRELRTLKQSVCCCVSYTLVLWYSINIMGIYMYYCTINKRLADSFPDKGMLNSCGVSSCFVFLHTRRPFLN